MAKICNNCACYEVCIYANPCRTEDCNLWKPKVVLCKDCKHYDNSEGIQWCYLNSKFYPGGFDWHCFPEDGYCSYGERKDNG